MTGWGRKVKGEPVDLLTMVLVAAAAVEDRAATERPPREAEKDTRKPSDTEDGPAIARKAVKPLTMERHREIGKLLFGLDDRGSQGPR